MAKYMEDCKHFEKKINYYTGRPILTCDRGRWLGCMGGKPCASYKPKGGNDGGIRSAEAGGQ